MGACTVSSQGGDDSVLRLLPGLHRAPLAGGSLTLEKGLCDLRAYRKDAPCSCVLGSVCRPSVLMGQSYIPNNV